MTSVSFDLPILPSRMPKKHQIEWSIEKNEIYRQVSQNYRKVIITSPAFTDKSKNNQWLLQKVGGCGTPYLLLWHIYDTTLSLTFCVIFRFMQGILYLSSDDGPLVVQQIDCLAYIVCFHHQKFSFKSNMVKAV